MLQNEGIATDVGAALKNLPHRGVRKAVLRNAENGIAQLAADQPDGLAGIEEPRRRPKDIRSCPTAIAASIVHGYDSKTKLASRRRLKIVDGHAAQQHVDEVRR